MLEANRTVRFYLSFHGPQRVNPLGAVAPPRWALRGGRVIVYHQLVLSIIPGQLPEPVMNRQAVIGVAQHLNPTWHFSPGSACF